MTVTRVFFNYVGVSWGLVNIQIQNVLQSAIKMRVYVVNVNNLLK